MKKIFGVSTHQKKEIDKYCFGECKKILIGAMIDDLMSLIPCKEEKCPYEEKRLKYGKLEGRIVWIRKLKSLQK